MRRRVLIVILIIAAVFAAGIPGVLAEGEVDGVLRVKISLDDQTEIPFFVDGNYTAEGSSVVTLERQLYTVKLVSGNLRLYYGGKLLCSGSTITLKQHTATEGRNNFIFLHITSPDNYYGYLGDIQFIISSGTIQVINHVYIEDYLYGVLPYEMNNIWPADALKAQAVAARNYAASRLDRSGDYDFTDESSYDQVYRGYNQGFANAENAVNATAGQVLTSGTAIIDAYYSGSNGGRTELPYHRWGGGYDWDYYQMVDDPYDLANTNSYYETIFFPAAIDGTHQITVSGNLEDSPPNDSKAIAYIKKKILDSGQLSSYGVNSMSDFELAGVPELTGTELEFNADSVYDFEYMARTAISDYSVNSVGDFAFAGITALSTNTYDAHGSQDHNRTPKNGVNNCLDMIRATGDFSVLVGSANVTVTGITLDLDSLCPYDTADPQYVAFSEVLGIFVVEPVYSGDVLTGFNLTQRRYGHGCGLSQRGAQERAKDSNPEISAYDKILAFYYPNTTLTAKTYNRPTLTDITITDHSNASVIMINNYDPITVRSTAGGATIGKLPVGARIKVVDPNAVSAGGYYWYKILYGTQYAYARSTYIQLDGSSFPDTCTVTFEMNGGSTKTPLIVNYGSSIESAPSASRAGCTFDGWFTDSGLSAQAVFPMIVTENTVLYAKWTPITYTISYELDGGTLASANPPSYTVESNPITLNNPKKPGYAFLGWTGTGLSGTVQTVTIPTGSYGNRAYTAKWKSSDINITSALFLGFDTAAIEWSTVSEEEGYTLSYELWRSTSSTGTYTKVSSQVGTSFTDTEFNAGTTYYYKVRACFDDGTSVVYGGFSGSVRPVPQTPSSVTAKSAGYSSLLVEWSSVPGVTGYMVYRSTSESGTYTKIATTYNTKTSYTSTGLYTGTPYYFKVCAYTGSTSVYGSLSTASEPVPPELAAMSGVKAETYYPTSIKISWAAVPGRTGYEIWRSVTEGVAPTYYKTTTYTYYNDIGLTLGKPYYYQVKAYRTVNGVRIYNGLSSIVSDTARLFKVTGQKAAMYSVTSNKITWNSVPGASGYEVIRCSAEGTEELKLVPTLYTYCYDKNIDPMKTYNYKIHAYRTVNGVPVYCEEFSDFAIAVNKVGGVKAVMYTVNSNKITWSSVSARTGYKVYWAESPEGTYTELTSPAAPYTNTYIYHKNTENTKTYCYKVYAYQMIGGVPILNGDADIVSAASKVTGVSASSYSYNSNKITWNAVVSRTGYEVYWSESRDGVYTKIPTSYTLTSTYIYHNGLTTDKEYFYKVLAYQTINGKKVYTGDSDIKSAKPSLKAVSGASAVKYSSSKIKLAWYTVSGAMGYEIERSTTGAEGSFANITTTASIYYYNSGLTAGTKYYYRIRAYRMVGDTRVCGGWSKIVSATA